MIFDCMKIKTHVFCYSQSKDDYISFKPKNPGAWERIDGVDCQEPCKPLCMILSEKSLACIQKKGISDSTFNELKKFMDHLFANEDQFIQALKKSVGKYKITPSDKRIIMECVEKLEFKDIPKGLEEYM